MKHLSLIMALVALFALGSVAFAEPIMNAQDSVPVSVYIAPWVWVNITDLETAGPGIMIDVEAEQRGASGSIGFTAGANTHAHLYGSFTGTDIPAGVTVATSLENIAVTSGTADWYYFIGNNEICMNGMTSTAAGTIAGDLAVNVTDVDITDRAGTYNGTAYANIYVW